METCIEVQNVVKRFRDQVVLKNVSISFEKGKIHGIVGRNGSGKTVLFKVHLRSDAPGGGRDPRERQARGT